MSATASNLGDGAHWPVLLPAALADQARSTGLDVLAVLRDDARLAEAIARSEKQSPLAGRWEPASTAQGHAGLALACAQLDACFPEDGWDVIGHDHLSRAVEALGAAGAGRAGIFAGAGGVALAARALSRGGIRYRGLSAQLDERVAGLATVAAAAADAPGRLPVHSWDVVGGLSGAGRQLLDAAPESAPARDALEVVLARLVALIGDDLAVGLLTPREHLRDGAWVDAPDGNVNCGLAHGVPGPVALLAVATRAGVRVPGQERAIEVAADWLVAQRTQDEYGVNWPYAVPVGGTPDPAGARAAWCYGAPGVAMALWLAGRALDRDDLCAQAVEALFAVLRRPVPSRAIDSPTFCHGVAGLLQIVLRVAAEAQEPQLAAGAGALVEQLLGQHEPDSLLGYRALQPDAVADCPGLLDGVVGVGLVLLAASVPVEPAWDRLFLLS